MKKMKNYFFAIMVSLMMFMPALSGTNTTNANTNTYVTLGYAGDIFTGAAAAAGLITAIESMFCPDTPQRRCKNGTCQSGACISFRSACLGEGSCGSSTEEEAS